MTAPQAPQQGPQQAYQQFQAPQPPQQPFVAQGGPQGPPQQFQGQQYYGPPSPSPFANLSILNWLVLLLPFGLLITIVVPSYGLFVYLGLIIAFVGGSALACSLAVKELEKKKN